MSRMSWLWSISKQHSQLQVRQIQDGLKDLGALMQNGADFFEIHDTSTNTGGSIRHLSHARNTVKPEMLGLYLSEVGCHCVLRYFFAKEHV